MTVTYVYRGVATPKLLNETFIYLVSPHLFGSNHDIHRDYARQIPYNREETEYTFT